MIRRTLLTLALLAVPAMVAALQPSPMQGQAPADTSKQVSKSMTHGKKATGKRHARRAAKPTAKDTSQAKP